MSSDNPQILIIDDNESIHRDFEKVLSCADLAPGSIVHAHQGLEGVERLREAGQNSRSIAIAFVDVQMPPGIDGVETARLLWKVDPNLQIVICTAYSGMSWSQLRESLGNRDQLMIIRKPFDIQQVCEIALMRAAA